MPDVGDWRTPTLTVSPFDGTTLATLSIVAPDGTATALAVTSSGGGATWTATAAYEFTAEGVWAERWTVTGTGKGKEYEYQIAVGVAQPAQLSTPLASIGHLVARLGRSLTAEEKAKAPAMLSDATDQIRGFCRREFTSNTGRALILRPVGNVLRLPNKPVLAVTQVEMVGVSGTPNRVMSIREWEFDGIDQVTIYRCPPDLWGYGIPPTATYADTYKVTTNDGGTVSKLVIGRCVRMVLRTLLAPTQAEGLVQERIGQYSYQYGQFPDGQSPGATVVMTEDDEKFFRKNGFRSSASTVQLRM